jgi:arylsulfatase
MVTKSGGFLPLETFKEYPPRQKPGSFSIDQVLDKLQTAGTGSN